MRYTKRASLAAIALIATGAPSLVRNRRNCAPKYVLLRRKVLAAIRKAILARFLVSSLPFPIAHIGSRFAENRHRSGDVNRIDLGQVGTSHAKQLRAQVELWRIPFLFLAKSFPPLLFSQTGAL